ncbi:MAG: hypothetical protein GY694_06255 [Gammaproteobacteria bacterium]|nr:hypothetical protein [Gammaproteobacteria bacterium]
MKTNHKILQILLLSSIILFGHEYSFSSDSNKEGKEKFVICNACHNPALNPPLAPPMWGIQRRYKRMSVDKEDFINQVSQFAFIPSLEKAVFQEAVNKMGLMPKVELPEDDLKAVATFIWEENFPPPCEHWKIGAENAKTSGDVRHEEKDRRKLKRFCK